MNFLVSSILIIIIVSFLIIGFIKGVKMGLIKSLFYLVINCLLLLLAYASLPTISNNLMYYDISWMNIRIEGYLLTKLTNLPFIIEKAYPLIKLLISSNDLYIIINALTISLIKLILFILLSIIIYSLGWLLNELLYNALIKHLINIISNRFRIFGGVIGLLQAFIFICIFSLPLSLIDEIADYSSYVPNSELESNIVNIANAHGNTFLGQLMTYPLFDQSLYDMMMNKVAIIEINDETASLNDELKVYVKTYSIILSHNLFEVADGEIIINYLNLNPLVIEDLTKTADKSIVLKPIIWDLLNIG